MRAQSALEFLTTYGWAFIIIALFLSIVLVFVSSKGTSTYAPSSCYITPNLPCTAAYLYSNSVGSLATIQFTNFLGTKMSFSANSIIFKPTFSSYNYTGNCLPTMAINTAQVTCNVLIPGLTFVPGSQIYPTFTIRYALCTGAKCSAYVYNTSGSATITVR